MSPLQWLDGIFARHTINRNCIVVLSAEDYHQISDELDWPFNADINMLHEGYSVGLRWSSQLGKGEYKFRYEVERPHLRIVK